MKYFIFLMFAMAQPLWGGSVTWRTFTGWDHGYTITVDGDNSKITLVEHLSKTKNKEPIVRDLPSAKALVIYAKTIAEMIPADGVGRATDDGRVIYLTIKSGDKVSKKRIDSIYCPTMPSHWHTEGESEEDVEKNAKAIAAEFKKSSEGYMLQRMMFDFKANYFDRFELDDSWVKPGNEAQPKSEKK